MQYLLSAGVPSLHEIATASQSWRFDPLSFLIGAAVAAVLAVLAYIFRGALGQVLEAAKGVLEEFMDYMKASTEENYRRLVATRARSLFIPAHAASLDAVFVEPELSLPFTVPQLVSDVEPIVESPTRPLHRVLGGHNQLLIQGTSGMGRTTVLAYLALVCATALEKPERRVEAEEMPDAVRERLPLYVLLPAMDWGGADQEMVNRPKGGAVGELLNAAVAGAGGGSAALAKPVRKYLEAGQAIVLVDGWDDLFPHQHPRAAAWLAELSTVLPNNLWLVSTGPRSYAPLAEAGFIPLSLTRWDAGKVEDFAKRWIDVYEPQDPSVTVSFGELADDLLRATRAGASSLELTLRALVYLSGQQVPVGRTALFDLVMDLLLREQAQEGEPWWMATCRATLGQVALDLQQGERTTVSREEIEAAIESALPPPEERTSRAAARVFRALTGDQGLLHSVGSNHYAFVHGLWQAYLAARQLVAIDPETLIEWLDDARWSDVLRFYAELGDMRLLVSEWLHAQDDVFYTRLCTLASWVSVAPEGAAWREGTMAVLARALLDEATPPTAKWMVAEALATTGMPGVKYFLKQALQHTDIDVRIAAVRGMMKVAGETDLPAFEAALEDQETSVQEAAVRALAHVGVESSRQRLEQVLLEGSDELRPIAAVALAGCGETGAILLRSLIDSEDVMTRRAAVYGLAQVGAWDVLQHTAREDEQWIVRSAAAAALEAMEEQEGASGVAPFPVIEQLPWLISWAAGLGEGVGMGDAAREMLQRALLQAEDVRIRLAAAQVLAQVGRPADVEVLRAAVADTELDVSTAALDALAEIGRRYNLRIAPVEKPRATTPP